jgi:hypothetical protein
VCSRTVQQQLAGYKTEIGRIVQNNSASIQLVDNQERRSGIAVEEIRMQSRIAPVGLTIEQLRRIHGMISITAVTNTGFSRFQELKHFLR